MTPCKLEPSYRVAGGVHIFVHLRPESGRVEVFDTEVRQLCCRISSRSRSLMFRGKLNKRNVRQKLGDVGSLSVDETRQLCRKILANRADATTTQQMRQTRRGAPTLHSAFQNWMLEKCDVKNAPNTVKEKRRHFDKYLGSLSARRLSDISDNDISNLMLRIKNDHGPIQANRVLFTLQGAINHASRKPSIPFVGPNPCMWVEKFPETPRERQLMDDELKRFREAVDAEHELYRDLIWMIIFTGQRKSAVCSMAWRNVDLTGGIWHLPPSRSKSRKPVKVPLVDVALDILTRRKESVDVECEWVFPSIETKHKGKHITDTKYCWKRICKRAGIEDLHVHDLRRSVASRIVNAGHDTALAGQAIGHVRGSRMTDTNELADLFRLADCWNGLTTRSRNVRYVSSTSARNFGVSGLSRYQKDNPIVVTRTSAARRMEGNAAREGLLFQRAPEAVLQLQCAQRKSRKSLRLMRF